MWIFGIISKNKGGFNKFEIRLHTFSNWSHNSAWRYQLQIYYYYKYCDGSWRVVKIACLKKQAKKTKRSSYQVVDKKKTKGKNKSWRICSQKRVYRDT
jgi:hypothetical protein